MLTQPFQVSYELLLDLCTDLPLVHEGVVWLRNIVPSHSTWHTSMIVHYLEAQREPYPFRYKGTKKNNHYNLCSL